MCTTITLDANTIDVVIDALTKKMGEINTCAILSGVRNDRMQEAYEDCEKALNIFTKAMESIGDVNTMAKEKR